MKDKLRYIVNTLSAALIISGASMLPPFMLAVFAAHRSTGVILGIMMLIEIAAGMSLQKLGVKTTGEVKPNILYMTTLFTWLLMIALSSVVYLAVMPGHGISDAILESAAGWTGTGIGSYDSADVPAELMLMRSVCNWLGGVGIVMLTITFLPPRRYIGWMLASTEFPGPDFCTEEGSFRNNYRKIFIIYGALALAQFILLSLAGMPVFTSVLSALSNSSSAGLHHIDNGVIVSLSLPIRIIISGFALISSLNVLILINIEKHKFGEIKKSSELRSYLLRILVLFAVISFFVIASSPEADPIRICADVLMQLISFISTSGYIISDISSWPLICITIILVQMFIGACSLSSGGGIKEARFLVSLKSVSYTLYKYIHPKSVRTLTFNQKPMKSDRAVRANLFIALFMLTYLLGALLLSLDNISVIDALNYSQAMITCTGTSAGSLGNPGSAASFSSFSKLVMSVLMLAGRLEIYPLLMIFFPGFWKSDSSR